MASRLTLENVQIIFRNFKGEKKQFNDPGDRNFCVLIEDPFLAMSLKKDGWNIKPLKPQGDEEPNHYLKVKVGYSGNYPPRIFAIKGGRKLQLHEQTVGFLDSMPLQSVDLIINPYDWSANGNTGTSAYLKTLIAVVDEDELDLKWAHIPLVDDGPLGIESGPVNIIPGVTIVDPEAMDYVEGEVV